MLAPKSITDATPTDTTSPPHVYTAVRAPLMVAFSEIPLRTPTSAAPNENGFTALMFAVFSKARCDCLLFPARRLRPSSTRNVRHACGLYRGLHARRTRKAVGSYLRATISMQVSSKIRSDVGENYHLRKEYGVLACYRHDGDNYGGGRPVAKREL